MLRTEAITAFVSSHWWPANPGHVLVIPNEHIENIYDFPDHLAAPLFAATRAIALAMKDAYGCGGISTRQHNEPDGGQDVWHFHQHVFPRFAGDRLYERHSERSLAHHYERSHRAAQLRASLLRQPASPTNTVIVRHRAGVVRGSAGLTGVQIIARPPPEES